MYLVSKIQPKFVDDQITQKWITHFYEQKLKNVITKKKILPKRVSKNKTCMLYIT